MGILLMSFWAHKKVAPIHLISPWKVSISSSQIQLKTETLGLEIDMQLYDSTVANEE